MRHLKRALLGGLITLAAFAAAAAPASACSITNGDHCYSIGYGWADNSTFLNEGVMGGVCTEAMNLDPHASFMTNEIWLNQQDKRGWVEAGVREGLAQGLPEADTPQLFWTDNSDKYGYNAHAVPGINPLGTTVIVHITHDTGNWWTVQFSLNNWFSAVYHSWQNTGAGYTIQAGTENAGGYANEAGAVGTGSRIQWRDTSGAWHRPLTQSGQVISSGAGLSGSWGSGTPGQWWEHAMNHAYPTTC